MSSRKDVKITNRTPAAADATMRSSERQRTTSPRTRGPSDLRPMLGTPNTGATPRRKRSKR